MSTSVIERTRQNHEDIELFERAVVFLLEDEPKNHRENVLHSHWMNFFADKIIDRCHQLGTIYKDEDGSRREEIQAIGGKGEDLFNNFYGQLRQIKQYHNKFANLQPERPEAEQLLNNNDFLEHIVRFTGEEGFGRYLDLHSFFERFINLKGVNIATIDYMKYLSIFYTFPDRDAERNKDYQDYLVDLFEYMVEFFKRSQPLFDIDGKIEQFRKDFETSWDNGTFKPAGYNEIDAERDADPLWCKYSRKKFTNQTVYESYKKGKNYKKAVQRYNTLYKDICRLELQVNRLAEFLLEQIEATKVNIEKKQARLPGEKEAEIEEDSDVASSSEEEEEVRTKENYPVGWDGNPIPYWLYKLHGLGIEYKCEICGNMSYWGRRAFERHFQEWRHSHGMKCLRIENTKEFFEVTKIQDALELNKKLKLLKERDAWDEQTMEEYEDQEGNVMNKKTFLDLRAQGLM